MANKSKSTNQMSHEQLGSRLGFILLSAGCAIGVGNVWKFPWMTGQYGGGAFVLVYIIFLILLGLPVMTMEFSIGRAAQKSPILMYKRLTPEKGGWQVHGIISFIGNILLMMFYTMVTGWLLYYFVSMVTGKFDGMNAETVSSVFGNLCADPITLVVYTCIVCLLGFFILSFSLKSGLERVTKYMMIALLIIMIVIAIKGLTMSGAKDGLSFYLVPDFKKISPSVIVAAMNQAFFTLSIGMGSMAIFGSYIKKDHALLGESLNVILLDTFVAITAGLIIFPACFTYNVEPGAGPSLIFITLPHIFVNMQGGRIWGSFFFLFMTFAAFSTVLAVCENILACIKDLTNWSRKKISIIGAIGITVLSIPCCLGFNVWSFIEPLGAGTGIMDLEDFIVSNCILPLGSLVFVLFCTNSYGWGFDNFMKEANTGKGLKVQKYMYGYMKYVLPFIIFIVFVLGVKDKLTTKDLFIIAISFIISFVVVSAKTTGSGVKIAKKK